MFFKKSFDIIGGTNMENELLLQALYTGTDIPDVIRRFEKSLRSTKDYTNIIHANKLAEYRLSKTDKNLLYRMRKNFNEIYSVIDKQYKDVRFLIEGRLKSLISFEKKIQKLLSEKRSLDLLRDQFAFRIIVFGENSPELISKCYDIANSIIKLSLEKGLTICESSPSDTGDFDHALHPEIIIPKRSGINKEFKAFVKDYFIEPKSNGYQSLHLLFKATTGEYFEVQIRTFEMHVHAESGEANHKNYKKNKYAKLHFDPKKIHIPGYGISPEGKIYDFIGLQEGLEILKRQKTY